MICRNLEACVETTTKGKKPDRCDNRKEECIVSSDNRQSVKCEEKKKKYILNKTRERHIVSYKMDGGIVYMDAAVPEQTAKCDYLYVIDGEKPTAVLIELKGVDVKKAMAQIENTLKLFPHF